MEQPLQTDRDKLIDSLKALFTKEHLLARTRHRCGRCGTLMQTRDATFWLYGTDLQWTVPLPVCICRQISTPPIVTEREQCDMTTGVAVPPMSKSWKELYKTALFETDKKKLSERIAQADLALAVRARELFHAGSEHLHEREAVDTAIYALHVLRSTTRWDKQEEGTKAMYQTGGRAA